MKKNFMIFLTVIASLLFLTTFSTTKADENIDNDGSYEVRTSLVMKVGDSATQVFTDNTGQKMQLPLQRLLTNLKLALDLYGTMFLVKKPLTELIV